MAENITPEFLAKMHAALRGTKMVDVLKVDIYPEKKKPHASNVIKTVPAATSIEQPSKPLDIPLADSVAQTTAETAADISVVKSQDKGEPAEGTDSEQDSPLMNEVLAAELHEVESALLHPLLNKATPPIEDGIFEVHDTHGQLIQRTPYVKGKIQGEVQLFDVKGNMIQTYECVDSIKQGMMRFFDESGVLTHEVPYENDKREGVGTFYVSGAKTAEISFHHDTMEGPARYYSTEGYVSAAALYHKNLLQGEMQCFDAQERLVKTLSYLKGKLNGESVTYYPGGAKVFERTHYLENVPVGKQIQFYEDGSVMSLKEYEKGKVVKEKSYDTKGHEILNPKGDKISSLLSPLTNKKGL